MNEVVGDKFKEIDCALNELEDKWAEYDQANLENRVAHNEEQLKELAKFMVDTHPKLKEIKLFIEAENMRKGGM